MLLFRFISSLFLLCIYSTYTHHRTTQVFKTSAKLNLLLIKRRATTVPVKYFTSINFPATELLGHWTDLKHKLSSPFSCSTSPCTANSMLYSSRWEISNFFSPWLALGESSVFSRKHYMVLLHLQANILLRFLFLLWNLFRPLSFCSHIVEDQQLSFNSILPYFACCLPVVYIYWMQNKAVRLCLLYS